MLHLAGKSQICSSFLFNVIYLLEKTGSFVLWIFFFTFCLWLVTCGVSELVPLYPHFL